MSTRCQIVTEEDGKIYPCKIYKHSDGYPEGVLPVLEPFAKRFAADRGADAAYVIAQAIRAFAFDDESALSFLGWGVDLDWHGDIEYVYVIKPSGDVLAYKVGRMPYDNRCPADALPPSCTLIEKTVSL